MEVNENYYGLKENWFPLGGTSSSAWQSQIPEDERFKLANFLNNTQSALQSDLRNGGVLGNAIYKAYKTDSTYYDPTFEATLMGKVFDQSIEFAGMAGNYCPYSTIVYYSNRRGQDQGSERELVNEGEDHIDVWNYFYTTYMTSITQGYGNLTRRWSDFYVNAPSSPSGTYGYEFTAMRWMPGDPQDSPIQIGNASSSYPYYNTPYATRNQLTFITQFPCRRTVLVPTITCSDDALNPTNVRTYDLYTYLNQYKETRPIVWSIQVEMYTKAGASDLPTLSDKRALRQTMMMASNTPLSLPFRGGSPYVQTMAAGGTLVDENNPFMAPQIIPTASNQTPIGGPINVGLGANMNASDLWQLTGGNGYDSFSVWAVINCGKLEFNNWTARIIGGGTPCRCYCNAADYTKAEFKEAVRHATACFGMFFTDSSSYAETAQLDDDTMHLGVLDNGIGYGEYTSGEKNTEQPQFGWKTMNESDYDPTNPPTPGPGPAPDPDTNPIKPSTPGFSLAVDNGSVCYTINKTEWRQIWNDIYGGSTRWKDLIDGLQLYGSNPLNAILNFRWYPFTLGGSSTSPLRLGATTVQPSTHVYHYISSGEEAFTSTSASFYWGRPKNFINSRKTKVRIWLPFYGFYELPTSLFISKELSIQFQYNLPDDQGVWFIMFGGSIYDYVECAPYIEIPITGDNSLQIAAAKKSRNLQIAATVATTVAGIAMGAAVAAPGLGAVITAAKETAWATGGMVSGALANIGPLAGEGLLTAAGAGIMGATGALASGGIKAANTIMNSALQIGTLSTNIPIHSTASDTTFLHTPFHPYIEVFQNLPIGDFNEKEADYIRTVGIACDKWTTISEMPENSMLATTGAAAENLTGMELTEANELNAILQSGFIR